MGTPVVMDIASPVLKDGVLPEVVSLVTCHGRLHYVHGKLNKKQRQEVIDRIVFENDIVYFLEIELFGPFGCGGQPGPK